MFTIRHKPLENTNPPGEKVEKYLECLGVQVYDGNKFDIKAEFEDGDAETFQVSVLETSFGPRLSHTCVYCDREIRERLSDETTFEMDANRLINKIIDHRKECLAISDLSFIRKRLLFELSMTEDQDYYTVALAIYYLSEVIRRRL
jgi:hypothetical protein